jgi:hypothetical protein
MPVTFNGKSTCVRIKAAAQPKKGRMKAMETGKAREQEHDFTLVLTSIAELTPEVEDALFQAGCDDATLSARSGRVFLTFSRKAESLLEAILSAINDVRRASIGADVLRVDDCNLVTQAEIAHRSRRSRQQIHQYITGERGPGSFPPPACNICEGHPLWYWCEVADWLWQNNLIREDVVREAEEVALINSCLEFEHQQKRNPGLAQQVRQSVSG